jgi:hypothetical protein
MIRRSLETVGRATDTEVTALTDRAAGLRSILSGAGEGKTHHVLAADKPDFSLCAVIQLSTTEAQPLSTKYTASIRP